MSKYILEDNEYHDKYCVELTEEQVRLIEYFTDNDLDCNGFRITKVEPEHYTKV